MLHSDRNRYYTGVLLTFITVRITIINDDYIFVFDFILFIFFLDKINIFLNYFEFHY